MYSPHRRKNKIVREFLNSPAANSLQSVGVKFIADAKFRIVGDLTETRLGRQQESLGGDRSIARDVLRSFYQVYFDLATAYDFQHRLRPFLTRFMTHFAI